MKRLKGERMMSERRFWFVIDKGELDYVQDNLTKEKITVTELEDLINSLNEENKELRKYNELLIKQKEESIDRCQEIYRIVAPFRRE